MPEANDGKKKPPARPIRARPLSTRNDVRRELAKTFWSMRRGEITPDTGRAFAYVLRQTADVIDDGVSDRIDELETRLATLRDQVDGNRVPRST